MKVYFLTAKYFLLLFSHEKKKRVSPFYSFLCGVRPGEPVGLPRPVGQTFHTAARQCCDDLLQRDLPKRLGKGWTTGVLS